MEQKSQKQNENDNDNSRDINLKERAKLVLEKEMLYNELEYNSQYDEHITFNHFYSIYQDFDCEIETVQHFPFLIQCEFLFSSFNETKLSLEPSKETPLTIMGRVKQFSTSRDENFKKDFLENIKVYSEIIGIDTTSYQLIPALAKIVDDTPLIKLKFLCILPTFLDYLTTKEAKGYEIIKTNILHIIDELYHANIYQLHDQQTKTFLFENLIKIGQIIAVKDAEIILHIILNFANNDYEGNELLQTEQKFLCMRLIAKLSESLGKEACDNYFIPQLYSFSFDIDDMVQIEVLSTLPNVAIITSYSMISGKIYDIVKTLSKNSAWKTRRACVEALPKLIKINKERSLQNHLNSKNYLFIELIDQLILDNQKEVRLAVIEKIGEIIHLLSKEELSNKLFDFYKNSIEEYYFNNRDKEIEGKYTNTIGMGKMLYYFAYNFPAILYCYGKEFWPQLKKIYKNLCEERDKSIKRSIISSFHEIANILGKEHTESDLLPLYDKYLQSEDKKEKNMAMRNLPKILQVVSRETKEKYYKYFEAMSLFKDNNNKLRVFNFENWKNKLDVVESIVCYYNLYEYDVIYSQILPPCLKFSLDDVYLVRKVSSRVLANVLLFLYGNNYKKESIVHIIHSFAYNKNIQMRVIFIKMCKVFFNSYLLFKEVICEILYILLKDKLIDTKISLAKLLSKIISNDKSFLYKDKEIHKMCSILIKNEKSQTILSYFIDKTINMIEEGSIIQSNEQGHYMFHNTMQSLIEEFHLDALNSNNNKEAEQVKESMIIHEKEEEKEKDIVINKESDNNNENCIKNEMYSFIQEK